jgi:hypothetical protein
MKPLNEKLILKDAINKVQFDTEWFYKLEDMAFYLKEDLSEVDYIFYLSQRWSARVCKMLFEDIYRARKKELEILETKSPSKI